MQGNLIGVSNKIKKIDIDECFRDIGYLKTEDENIIQYENGYYQIHFYKKRHEYYTEDKREIVYLIINEALKQWKWRAEK